MKYIKKNNNNNNNKPKVQKSQINIPKEEYNQLKQDFKGIKDKIKAEGKEKNEKFKKETTKQVAEKSAIIGQSFGFIAPNIRNEIINEKIDRPFQLISYGGSSKEYKRKKKEENRLEKLKTKKIGSKKKREIGFYHIPYENCIYDQYLPLHELWLQYIKDVMQNQKGPNFLAKFLRADLHGAFITVTKSTCPSLIGQKGLVIQETENTFKIITKENKVNIIPKEACYFYIECCEQSITIIGKHFCFRACDRSTKKYKARKNIEL
ncbi:hypothetical protein DICPUDRAFT_81703 [Dictyostelium purpureum]|uniref:Ribonuclease P protein subunit p29 n=1 Tax=Dictyostelium purpureum TaxID=5786 RepID=F0ZUB8_DICPU|nr:uncharacterized protein DICPUDRAFT_81703 [Dictyostelium purpureum]EGC32471.1 hypothetical protein DICPUDRAFT_81703 [Dictyostelium purpureum]|eukprot:XP_003291005.1 hypothetical protein DICPUDRAFT_81703 [Dictyostelium purpureum]